MQLTDREKADIAASFQNAAVDVLIQKARSAIGRYAPRAILLSGGVSANKLLRERLHEAAAELALPFICPEMRHTTDNAAMIGVAGYFSWLKKGKTAPGWEAVMMDANLRL